MFRKAFAALALTLSPAVAHAAPVQFNTGAGANGHWYEFVSTVADFESARLAAEAMSFSGLDGHLVTVTSQEENDFLTSTFSAVYWLGGSDSAVPDTWEWITGPEAGTVFYVVGQAVQPGYSSWAQREPNNFINREEVIVSFGGGVWNDTSPLNQYGYIVEYSDVTTASPVPLPAGAVLLLSAVGALGLRRIWT